MCLVSIISATFSSALACQVWIIDLFLYIPDAGSNEHTDLASIHSGCGLVNDRRNILLNGGVVRLLRIHAMYL